MAKGGRGSSGTSRTGSSTATVGTSVVSSPTRQEARQAAQTAKQETKTAQQTVKSAIKEVKKQGEIANLGAYNQALDVLKSTKPKAAVKAESKFGRAKTRAEARGLGAPINIPTEVPTEPPTESPTEKPIEVPTEPPTESPTSDFDLQSYVDEQFGALGSKVTGQLSDFQTLLSDLKSQRPDQTTSSTTETTQLDEFKPFDPDLFKNLLGQVEGSSMKQREQLQEFKEREEARDYGQALKSYRF